MSGRFKKTPKDATEFEREQLRFFLTKSDPAAMLAEINPSLAWLPMLAQLKLIGRDTQLASWIEKNFAEADAIREVAANVHFFDPDTAEVLEFRLNHTEGLPPLLTTCWRLIIRHMRTTNRATLRNEWFDIAPRIKRSEQSTELLERLANTLRPKLRVGKRLHIHSEEESRREPKMPSDLISIDYEIEDGITDEEVLAAWPESMPDDIDEKLLRLLTNALTAALEDATEAGVESDLGYGVSDADVPSVAKHQQNAYSSGFLPIVRVSADIWMRLTHKDAELALSFVHLWQASPYRLIRRLALFAAADTTVPADVAADVLLTLSAGELFLTSSSVEVYRLIDKRWRDFPADQRRAIERRVAEGPPPDCFSKDQAQNVDRCRFDLLGYLKRSGLELGTDAQAMLADIRKRWPNWGLKPAEHAGFHVWHETSSGVVGDPTRLSGVPDAQLLSAAKKAADESQFMEGDAWQALCQTDVVRALRGLVAQAAVAHWPAWAWRPFLWAAAKLQDVNDVTQVAQSLLEYPSESFGEISEGASWWLNEVAQTLDEDLLWPLWDRIAGVVIEQTQEARDHDDYSAALNHPSGHLAEVLLKKLPKGAEGSPLAETLRTRLNVLVTARANVGHLARIRLAKDVSLLFERAPEWTKQTIVPLFDWSSAEATAAWSARKYANYIGSPELFLLTKESFLTLFARTKVSHDDVRIFASWLAAIAFANQEHRADYPITSGEIRSALRKAGPRSLSSVGHRIAVEMEQAKSEDKLIKWRNVIGPVFQSIWPLDVELQTSASTFKLVQILRASGTAFREAAEVIVPFIRSDDSGHTSIYSISTADDILYSTAPDKLLDLVTAVVGDPPSRAVYGLRKALDRIREHAPQLANAKKFQKLLSLAAN